MKKIILAAAALLVSAGAFADTRDFVTNSAGSNLYVGINGGLNIGTNDVFSGNTITGIAPVAGIEFGKWIAPAIAVEANLGLGNLKVGDETNSYFSFGGAVVWDASSTFGGYKADRVVSIMPFAKADFVKAALKGADFGVGIKFPVRLGSRFYVVPEFNASLCGDGVLNGQENGIGSIAQAKLGLVYSFSKKYDFTSLQTAVQPYVLAVAEAEAAKAEALAKAEAVGAEKVAADKANADLLAENTALKYELSTSAAENEAIVKGLMSAPACVYFEIGQARLSVKEAAHLDYLVKYVISQGKNLTFTISGYTDKNTGSYSRNAKLAKQRADFIKKLLVKKYGLSQDQFVIETNPNTNVFTTIELNRAVIIKAN